MTDVAATAEQVGAAGNGSRVGARELDRSLVKGMAWTGASKALAQAFSWVASIYVARLLSPGDYGILGMAMVYIGITSMVTEFGLSSAVVALRDLTPRQIAQLNSVAMLLGASAVALSALAAGPISWFFETPAVSAVIVALSCMVFLDSMRTVPAAVLAKRMEFRFLALTEATKSLLVSTATVALAFAGFGYWALVGGVVLGALVPTVMILCRHPVPLRFPRVGELREALAYTKNYLLTNLSWYSYTNADFAVAGRLLGQAPLGEYTFAWTLASAPAEKAVGIVNRVMPSVFAAASSDPAALRRYLLRITEAASLLILPAGIGLALVAHDLVAVLLGEKWLGAVTTLRILALYAVIHSLSVLVPPMMLAIGQVRVLSRIVLACACVLPPAFVAGGLLYGSVGIALVWITIYPVVVAVMYRAAFAAIHMTWREYGSALTTAAVPTAAMALVVVAVGLAPALENAPLRLATTVTLGAAVYAGCLWVFFRDRVELVRTSFSLLRAGQPDSVRSNAT